MAITVRPIREADLERCAEIYKTQPHQMIRHEDLDDLSRLDGDLFKTVFIDKLRHEVFVAVKSDAAVIEP